MKIEPSCLKGKVRAPPSKSVTHRALICAALSRGRCRIENALVSDDTLATAAGLKTLGAVFEKDFIDGTRFLQSGGRINCGESGSTLRFLLPLACLAGEECALDGVGRLRERPIQPLVDALNSLGGRVESTRGFAPIRTKPGLIGGECVLPGDVSSQFVSALLIALPACRNNSFIRIKTALESKPYVDLTLDVMRHFGVSVEERQGGYAIRPQSYASRDYEVEADWSAAAFWLVVGAIGGSVRVENVKPSKQADYAIVRILEKMGAKITMKEGAEVMKSELSGIEIDVSQFPDLVPVLAVAGCFAEGQTRLYNAARLRLKESDRLSAIAQELKKMGAEIEEKPDELVIKKSALRGANLKSHGDHRIAMALSIAASYAESASDLDDADCISKSYPLFFKDFQKLGGRIE